MYKQVIFALFVTMAFIDFVNGSCRDLTLDECDYGENGPFETKKGIIVFNDTSSLVADHVAFLLIIVFGTESNLAKCQGLCQIYEDRCVFFIFDTESQQCEVFDYPYEEYTKSCNIFGASSSPDITTCKDESIEDPCIVSTKFSPTNIFYHNLKGSKDF